MCRTLLRTSFTKSGIGEFQRYITVKIYLFNSGLMIGELKIGPVDKMRDAPH